MKKVCIFRVDGGAGIYRIYHCKDDAGFGWYELYHGRRRVAPIYRYIGVSTAVNEAVSRAVGDYTIKFINTSAL